MADVRTLCTSQMPHVCVCCCQHKTIGSGGYGVVVSASDKRKDAKVAVKKVTSAVRGQWQWLWRVTAAVERSHVAAVMLVGRRSLGKIAPGGCIAVNLILGGLEAGGTLQGSRMR